MADRGALLRALQAQGSWAAAFQAASLSPRALRREHYNYLLAVAAKAERWETLARCEEAMASAGVAPDGNTFHIFLAASVHARDWSNALLVFAEATAVATPTPATLLLLLRACAIPDPCCSGPAFDAVRRWPLWRHSGARTSGDIAARTLQLLVDSQRLDDATAFYRSVRRDRVPLPEAAFAHVAFAAERTERWTLALSVAMGAAAAGASRSVVTDSVSSALRAMAPVAPPATVLAVHRAAVEMGVALHPTAAAAAAASVRHEGVAAAMEVVSACRRSSATLPTAVLTSAMEAAEEAGAVDQQHALLRHLASTGAAAPDVAHSHLVSSSTHWTRALAAFARTRTPDALSYTVALGAVAAVGRWVDAAALVVHALVPESAAEPVLCPVRRSLWSASFDFALAAVASQPLVSVAVAHAAAALRCRPSVQPSVDGDTGTAKARLAAQLQRDAAAAKLDPHAVAALCLHAQAGGSDHMRTLAGSVLRRVPRSRLLLAAAAVEDPALPLAAVVPLLPPPMVEAAPIAAALQRRRAELEATDDVSVLVAVATWLGQCPAEVLRGCDCGALLTALRRLTALGACPAASVEAALSALAVAAGLDANATAAAITAAAAPGILEEFFVCLLHPALPRPARVPPLVEVVRLLVLHRKRAAPLPGPALVAAVVAAAASVHRAPLVAAVITAFRPWLAPSDQEMLLRHGWDVCRAGTGDAPAAVRLLELHLRCRPAALDAAHITVAMRCRGGHAAAVAAVAVRCRAADPSLAMLARVVEAATRAMPHDSRAVARLLTAASCEGVAVTEAQRSRLLQRHCAAALAAVTATGSPPCVQAAVSLLQTWPEDLVSEPTARSVLAVVGGAAEEHWAVALRMAAVVGACGRGAANPRGPAAAKAAEVAEASLAAATWQESLRAVTALIGLGDVTAPVAQLQALASHVPQSALHRLALCLLPVSGSVLDGLLLDGVTATQQRAALKAAVLCGAGPRLVRRLAVESWVAALAALPPTVDAPTLEACAAAAARGGSWEAAVALAHDSAPTPQTNALPVRECVVDVHGHGAAPALSRLLPPHVTAAVAKVAPQRPQDGAPVVRFTVAGSAQLSAVAAAVAVVRCLHGVVPPRGAVPVGAVLVRHAEAIAGRAAEVAPSSVPISPELLADIAAAGAPPSVVLRCAATAPAATIRARVLAVAEAVVHQAVPQAGAFRLEALAPATERPGHHVLCASSSLLDGGALGAAAGATWVDSVRCMQARHGEEAAVLGLVKLRHVVAAAEAAQRCTVLSDGALALVCAAVAAHAEAGHRTGVPSPWPLSEHRRRGLAPEPLSGLPPLRTWLEGRPPVLAAAEIVAAVLDGAPRATEEDGPALRWCCSVLRTAGDDARVFGSFLAAAASAVRAGAEVSLAADTVRLLDDAPSAVVAAALRHRDDVEHAAVVLVAVAVEAAAALARDPAAWAHVMPPLVRASQQCADGRALERLLALGAGAPWLNDAQRTALRLHVSLCRCYFDPMRAAPLPPPPGGTSANAWAALHGRLRHTALEFRRSALRNGLAVDAIAAALREARLPPAVWQALAVHPRHTQRLLRAAAATPPTPGTLQEAVVGADWETAARALPLALPSLRTAAAIKASDLIANSAPWHVAAALTAELGRHQQHPDLRVPFCLALTRYLVAARRSEARVLGPVLWQHALAGVAALHPETNPRQRLFLEAVRCSVGSWEACFALAARYHAQGYPELEGTNLFLSPLRATRLHSVKDGAERVTAAFLALPEGHRSFGDSAVWELWRSLLATVATRRPYNSADRATRLLQPLLDRYPSYFHDVHVAAFAASPLGRTAPRLLTAPNSVVP